MKSQLFGREMKFKILLVTSIFFAMINLSHQATKKKYEFDVVKIKKVSCNVSAESFEKHVYPNASCFMKVWNRRTSTLNVYAKFKIKIFKMNVSQNMIFYLCN